MESNHITYWWDIMSVETNSDKMINFLNKRIDVYTEFRLNDFVNTKYKVYCGDIELNESSFVWEYIPSQSLLLVRNKIFNNKNNFTYEIKNEFISNFPVDIEINRIVPNVNDVWKFISHITNNPKNIQIVTLNGQIVTLKEYGIDSTSVEYEYIIDYAHSDHEDKRKCIEFDGSSNQLKLPLYGNVKENYIYLYSNMI